MRKINCTSCSFSCTEADREWDAVVASQRCPKCSASIQDLQLQSAGAVHKGNQYTQLDQQPIHSGVVVTDVQMPFWSMVTFMVKWAFASIPAFLIIFAFYLAAAGFLGAGFHLFTR